MKTRLTDNTHAPRYIAIMGDDRLIREFRVPLEAIGFTLLDAVNEPDIKAAGQTFVAGIELSLSDDNTKKDAVILLDSLLPPSTIILSSSVMVTAARQATWMTHPERLIGICAFPTLMTKPLAETAIPVRTTPDAVSAARAFFTELGIEMVHVQDRVGMIFPAILVQAINEAFLAVQQQVASPQDIDKAMKAGAGFPLGPIEWGEAIGFPAIVSLLDALRNDSGEDRYRVPPLLRELSLSGKFWNTRIDNGEPIPVQTVLQLDDVANISGATKHKQRRVKIQAHSQGDTAADAKSELPQTDSPQIP